MHMRCQNHIHTKTFSHSEEEAHGLAHDFTFSETESRVFPATQPKAHKTLPHEHFIKQLIKVLHWESALHSEYIEAPQSDSTQLQVFGQANDEQSGMLAECSSSSAGEVFICKHNRSAPLESAPDIVRVTDCKAAGRLLDSVMSTGMSTLPAATGHLTPSHPKLPAPKGKLNVFAEHNSPVNFWEIIDAVMSISKVPPDTAAVVVPEPVTVVFTPRVTESGVKPVIVPTVFPPPQSFHASFNELASTRATTDAPKRMERISKSK